MCPTRVLDQCLKCWPCILPFQCCLLIYLSGLVISIWLSFFPIGSSFYYLVSQIWCKRWFNWWPDCVNKVSCFYSISSYLYNKRERPNFVYKLQSNGRVSMPNNFTRSLINSGINKEMYMKVNDWIWEWYYIPWEVRSEILSRVVIHDGIVRSNIRIILHQICTRCCAVPCESVWKYPNNSHYFPWFSSHLHVW